MKTSKRSVEGFLEELFALSIKYNIEIKGCGCCGSPYLEEIEKKSPIRYTVLEDNDCLEMEYGDD